MAEARWCGHNSRARAIPKNDLPAISASLSAHANGMPIESSSLGFVVSRDDLSGHILCPRYYDPLLKSQLAALENSHRLVTFGSLLAEGVLEMQSGDELGKLAYGTGPVPFIRTSDISNWELKADPKHGVDRRLYLSLKHRQDVRTNDILMVKDGTYLIGTCAIVTDHDAEIVYQSHLYKIRVRPNNVGLDAPLLLALLSSRVVQRQIRSKQFTHDIIDSLGDRIRELVLPIPRGDETRRTVSAQVQKAVALRAEARELARRARLAVVEGILERGRDAK